MAEGPNNPAAASPDARRAAGARAARTGPLARRIVCSILAVVWTSLLAAGTCVYLLTRATLIDNLDETILARIASLPELERPSAIPTLDRGAVGAEEFEDRYVLQFPSGRRVTSTTATRPGSPADAPRLEVLRREFTEAASGVVMRTLTVRASAHRQSAEGPLVPVTAV
jgi:hypothetical protein